MRVPYALNGNFYVKEFAQEFERGIVEFSAVVAMYAKGGVKVLEVLVTVLPDLSARAYTCENNVSCSSLMVRM